MIHLSDEELINYTIKYSNDPVRVRLATYMERIKGAIIDDLEAAGMDPSFCTFRTDWGSERLPGQYISHLEEEIGIRDDTILELQKELEEQKARTIADLIQELNQQITTEKYIAAEAQQERDQAIQNERRTAEKMKVWRALSTDTTQQ